MSFRISSVLFPLNVAGKDQYFSGSIVEKSIPVYITKHNVPPFFLVGILYLLFKKKINFGGFNDAN